MNILVRSWIAVATLMTLSAAAQGFAAGVSRATMEPWLRLDTSVEYLTLDPKGQAAAYINPESKDLRIVEFNTGSIYRVTNRSTGGSFFWAPDGFRLFYRVLKNAPNGGLTSEVRAYDRALHKSFVVSKLDSGSGFLTFDPRDRRMALLHDKGILSRQLVFPDERLARWQAAQRSDRGRWLVAQNGVLWVTQGGQTMRRMEADEESRVSSFDLSPDGHSIAWATVSGKVFMSRDGEEPKFVGYGLDPAWHPVRPLLVYAGARRVGNVAIGYDLRVTDEMGSSRWLGSTEAAERWPRWVNDGKRLVYARATSTDLYQMTFE